MNKKFLNAGIELCEIEAEKYIEFDNFVQKCLGYKMAPKIKGLPIIHEEGKNYVSVKDAYKTMKINYNKRNSELIDLHKILGIKVEYSIEALSMKPIIDYLKEQKIYYHDQHTIQGINRRIDLYLPNYEIAIECDENNHIDRDENDEISRESELNALGIDIIHYNPNMKNFDIKNVIVDIKAKIQEKSIIVGGVDEINNAIKEFNDNSSEKTYYSAFGLSILGDGFCVDFDNIWKLCGYSSKGCAKKLLCKKFIENQDYIIKATPSISETDENIKSETKAASPIGKAGQNIKNDKNLGWSGMNREIIMLNRESFKIFCILADTKEAIAIRKWYVKLEDKYIKLLLKTKDILVKERTRFIDINKNKSLEIRKEINLQKAKYKQSKNNTVIVKTDKIDKTHKIPNKKPTLLKTIIDDVMISLKKDKINDLNLFALTSRELNSIDYDDIMENYKAKLVTEYTESILKIRGPNKLIGLFKNIVESNGYKWNPQSKKGKIDDKSYNWTEYTISE